MLVDFDISKTPWTKHRVMVNKPFWHIGDFVLASYTFGCVKMSDFVPSLQRRWFRCWRPSAWRKAKNLPKTLMLFIMSCWSRMKPSLGTVSNAIDEFEPSTARKTATIQAEARKSDSTAWQRLASRYQTR